MLNVIAAFTIWVIGSAALGTGAVKFANLARKTHTTRTSVDKSIYKNMDKGHQATSSKQITRVKRELAILKYKINTPEEIALGRQRDHKTLKYERLIVKNKLKRKNYSEDSRHGSKRREHFALKVDKYAKKLNSVSSAEKNPYSGYGKSSFDSVERLKPLRQYGKFYIDCYYDTGELDTVADKSYDVKLFDYRSAMYCEDDKDQYSLDDFKKVLRKANGIGEKGKADYIPKNIVKDLHGTESFQIVCNSASSVLEVRDPRPTVFLKGVQILLCNVKSKGQKDPNVYPIELLRGSTKNKYKLKPVTQNYEDSTTTQHNFSNKVFVINNEKELETFEEGIIKEFDAANIKEDQRKKANKKFYNKNAGRSK